MANHDSPEEIRKTVRHHWQIGAGLFGLVLFSIGFAKFFHFATWIHLTVGLLISSGMAGLVLWYFMHLNDKKAPMVHQILITSLVFFLVLIFLSLLAFTDPAGYHIKP